MHCYVYKGDKTDDRFLFLGQEYDPEEACDFLPSELLTMMGALSFVVEFELDSNRKLPQADAKQVMSDIAEKGFYLQMPQKDMAAEEAAYFGQYAH